MFFIHGIIPTNCPRYLFLQSATFLTTSPNPSTSDILHTIINKSTLQMYQKHGNVDREVAVANPY
jgi:hypothetical protein